MLAQFFNKHTAEWTRAVMSVGMHLRWSAVNFPTPKEAGQVPFPEFQRTREWLHKVEVTLTGMDDGSLTERLTGAMRLRGDEAGKRQKAGVGTMGDCQRIRAFYAKEQHADGVC